MQKDWSYDNKEQQFPSNDNLTPDDDQIGQNIQCDIMWINF
jgi:hypothetical protein